jgi:hypothetical protein
MVQGDTAMTDQDARADRLETEQLEREAFIERLKGPRGPSTYIPPPPSAAQIEAAASEFNRLERLKWPDRTLPGPRVDQLPSIEERKKQLAHERLREKLKGPM